MTLIEPKPLWNKIKKEHILIGAKIFESTLYELFKFNMPIRFRLH